MTEHYKQKTVVVGAGPVGALAALYAAQRGHELEIYELRSDLRDPSTTLLNFTKSINLSLSERGINAMRQAGRPGLLENILNQTFYLEGRMIHGKKASGELYEQSQDYDVHGRVNYAADRGMLNKALLDELEAMPNVQFKFNHKFTGADFKKHKAWFEKKSSKSSSKRDDEIEISFDFLIGADGAHSAVRHHLMKYQHIDYQQEYIDTLWCEFQIPAPSYSPKSHIISPHHLHIWPGQDYMFIAIPNFDFSFTCTLFMPSAHFTTLEEDPSEIPSFFDTYFPAVTSLIPPSALITFFTANPHLPLISIKCKPYHFSDSAVILGDAAHAMVPFYGQGMNAGLEDVRVLFSILDTHLPPSPPDKPNLSHQHALALQEYSHFRAPDAHAINDLALQNYQEMRAGVTSPVYRLRKWLEEMISVWLPSTGWKTKYSRVSFGNERYSEVVRRSEWQGRVLVWGMVGLIGSPVVVGVLVGGLRWWRRISAGRGLGVWGS